MGFFSKRNRWANATITPDPQWIPPDADRPDMFDIALQAIVLSGRDPNTINPVKVRNVVYTMVQDKCEKVFMRMNIPSGVADMNAIFTRPDFEERMLWDYLTHHGAKGMGMQQGLAQFLRSDAVMAGLVEGIQAGYADLDRTP